MAAGSCCVRDAIGFAVTVAAPSVAFTMLTTTEASAAAGVTSAHPVSAAVGAGRDATNHGES
jgi:hypothetical protein